MSATSLLKILAILSSIVGLCLSHGRLTEPPSRASAWRFGFNTPKDYNDNEGFCGGFSHQYQTQGGKCGICGDPWDESPRAHEVGGLYATGVIVRHYQEGQVVNITIDITANHLGHFEVKICPDPEIEATQECLDIYRLSLADGTGVDFNISSEVGLHTMVVKLPEGLTCNHCVLQWRYVAANNWGTCPDGTGSLGCGPQEEFRACADISISPKGAGGKDEGPTGSKISGDIEKNKDLMRSLSHEKKLLKCKGNGIWASLPGASKWCTINCNHLPSYCPRSQCLCY